MEPHVNRRARLEARSAEQRGAMLVSRKSVAAAQDRERRQGLEGARGGPQSDCPTLEPMACGGAKPKTQGRETPPRPLEDQARVARLELARPVSMSTPKERQASLQCPLHAQP